MEINQILLREYKQKDSEPVYCTIGSQRVIVPSWYKGNIDNFVDDIFSYATEADKYARYNQSQTLEDKKLDVPMFKTGEVSFLPPFDLYTKELSADEITKRSTLRALRRYKSAVKKVLRAQKEYPDKNFSIRMEKDYLSELDALHRKYVVNKMGYHLAKVSKWSAAQTVNIIAGAAGALPLATYYILDKKVHFAENKTHGFIKEKLAPYIRKGLLKGLIPITFASGMHFISKASKSDKEMSQTSGINVAAPAEKSNAIVFSNRAEKYNITDMESFDRLFNNALPDITISMMPTEILVLEPYSDNGTINNTLGLGSYYLPKSGNPKDTNWIKTSTYLKDHPNIEVTGQHAFDLMVGWFKYRENGRVYKKLYEKLQGAQLTIPEFTAICTCMYNDEKNGAKLCDFVRKNYKDPIKCAAYLIQLKPGNAKFIAGILRRHTHEALTYLNMNNYCDKVPYFFVKEGINSKGKKYYVTSVSQLKPEDCWEMSKDLAEGRLDAAKEVQKSILSYHCKDGQAVYEICQKNGLNFLFTGKSDANGKNNLYAKLLNNDKSPRVKPNTR